MLRSPEHSSDAKGFEPTSQLDYELDKPAQCGSREAATLYMFHRCGEGAVSGKGRRRRVIDCGSLGETDATAEKEPAGCAEGGGKRKGASLASPGKGAEVSAVGRAWIR